MQMSQPTNYANESTHQQCRWVNPPTIQMSQPTNNTEYCWWVDSSVLLVGWLICIVGGLTHLYCWWDDSSILLVGWPPTMQMSYPTNNTDESTHQLYKWVNPPTMQMSHPTNNTDALLVGWLICIVGGLTHLYCWWDDSSVLLVGWLIYIVGGMTHLYCWWVDSSV
jgi:hypothetical protein